jgi:secondary thiamine-phosphate synthase enzyme
MMIVTREISRQTKGECDIIDVTEDVKREVASSGVKNGNVTIFVTGSTTGLTTIEFEPGLVADLKALWDRLAPRGIPYGHDARWGDGNGYSHVRSALLGVSLVIPFSDKKLLLGTWQQIVLVDFDNRPRTRNVVLQIMGE